MKSRMMAGRVCAVLLAVAGMGVMSEAALAAPATTTAMAEHLFRGSAFRTQTCGSECTTLWQSEQTSSSGALHEQLFALRAWLGLYGRHEEGRGNRPLVVSLRLAEGTDVVYVQTQGPGGAIYEQPWRVPPAERTPYGYDTAVWASIVYRHFEDLHGPGPDWYVNLEIQDEWGDTVRYPEPKWYPPANGECSMEPFSIPAHYTVHRWTYGLCFFGKTPTEHEVASVTNRPVPIGPFQPAVAGHPIGAEPFWMSFYYSDRAPNAADAPTLADIKSAVCMALADGRYPAVAAFYGNPCTTAPEALLERYKPELRYDSQEGFFADSAAMMTDNSGNRLLDRNNRVVFGSSTAPLTLPSLNTTYFIPRSDGSVRTQLANDADFVDAAGNSFDTYQSAAAYMHGRLDYFNRIYGRVATGSDGSTWLQYWFFYYFDAQQSCFLTICSSEHEGDWEGIQIRLNPDRTPGDVVYARHAAGDQMRCSWSAIEKTSDTPIVYVAFQSHASYFTAGQHDGDDSADGLGLRFQPTLVPMVGNWTRWRGRWGASGDNSPLAPIRHERWGSPNTFAANAQNCVLGGDGRVAFPARVGARSARTDGHRPPLAPTLRARRTGKRHARLTYRLRGAARRRSRASAVYLSLHARGRRSAPVIRRVRAHRRDRVTLHLPAGRGRFVARVSVVSRGLRSRVRTVRVR